MPAATSEPKAKSRMISVAGTASFSARLKSSPSVLSSAFCALASPNSSTTKPGFAFWAAAVASRAP